jgi:hypothetical protein
VALWRGALPQCDLLGRHRVRGVGSCALNASIRWVTGEQTFWRRGASTFRMAPFGCQL